jgi:hypothetical protein
VPARLVVAALALGFTLGQTVVAIPMIIVTRRICGPAAVHGVWHAAAASLVAGVAGAVVGAAATLALPVHHKLLDAGLAALGAAAAVIAFGVVAYLLDSDDLKTVRAMLRRLVRSRR